MYNVLIVEDEPRSREGMERLVNWEKYGFTIAAKAAGGEEALRICKESHIYLIVTDILMPGMDGLDLVSHVRREFPGTKIILFSAYREFDYAHRALKMGVRHYILKPVEENKLIGALQEVRVELDSEVRPDPAPVISVPQSLTESIKEIIAEEYANEKLGVDYIARKLSYNASYLGRAFHASEGVSIRSYIKKQRVRIASRLLLETNKKILEIAYDTGFHDISTFYNTFHQITGKTPAEFRSIRKGL